MNGYVGFYRGNRIEVYAEGLYAAKQKIIAELNVPPKREYMVSVMLAERDGQIVVHDGAEL